MKRFFLPLLLFALIVYPLGFEAAHVHEADRHIGPNQSVAAAADATHDAELSDHHHGAHDTGAAHGDEDTVRHNCCNTNCVPMQALPRAGPVLFGAPGCAVDTVLPVMDSAAIYALLRPPQQSLS